MIDYYLRCKPSEAATVRAIGVLLGLLQVNEAGEHVAIPPHAWHEVGEIRRNDVVVKDAQGKPYWHANLRFAGDSLLDHATAVFARMEAEGQSVPSALKGKLSRGAWPELFVVDANGEATMPSQPAVVWL